MKTLLALLLLIPLNLYSELSEWENQTWKCLGQDLLGTGEFNGFAHCIKKQNNENYYWDFNDDGFIKDGIVFHIPEDKSFIIFSEYKDEINNGMQFGISKNSDMWFSKYLDGENHGLEIIHQKSDGLTNIREYWEGQFSETTPLEIKEIIDIDNDYVISQYNAYLTDENGEFIPNTFFYQSKTKLDRANNMQPIETETQYVKINNLNEKKSFGQGVYKIYGNTYYLNFDERDESGVAAKISEGELEEDVILFSMQLLSLNMMKEEFGEENMIFQNNLKEKYGVNFENTFDEILNELDEYISQNLVAGAPSEIKLKCFLGYYGANNDQEINIFYTLKNETLYDDDGNEFYLKEKSNNLYVFGHKDDDLHEYRLNRNNLDMVMIYNLGKNKSELSCSNSAPLL